MAKEFDLDEELLRVIFTQKVTRDTTKKFYRVQRIAPQLLREWKQGRSMLQLSRKHAFPPILMGMMIFQANGCSKKVFWKHVREPNAITDARLKREIIEITDLLDEPIRVNGWDINWIESKASFGDTIEIGKNVRKQLEPYTELFGDGLVVYWFGFVDEAESPKGIFITDSSLLHMDCRVLKTECKRPLQ
ncbi:MAG: TPD domain-containing protein [Methanomassiliicoccales archaeon]